VREKAEGLRERSGFMNGKGHCDHQQVCMACFTYWNT
jgi:hypothetical protein